MSTDLTAPMVFDDLEPVEVPVTIKGRSYVLRELDTPSITKFRNAVTVGVKVEGDAVTRTVGVGALDPLLVQLSLKELGSDGVRRPVSAAFVDLLHPSVVHELAARAVAINPELSGKATDAKN